MALFMVQTEQKANQTNQQQKSSCLPVALVFKRQSLVFNWSGRQDLNLRPFAPKCYVGMLDLSGSPAF